MPIAFDIHVGTQADYEDLLRLNKALFDYEADQGFSHTYNLEWTYSDEGKKYFETFIDDDMHATWIATNDEGVAVGYLIAVVREVAYRSPQTVSEIEMLYIDEGYRCSGIGRCLVDEFKKWSNEQGAGILRVGALAANKHARDFYEKWGFDEAEIMYEIAVKNEE